MHLGAADHGARCARAHARGPGRRRGQGGASGQDGSQQRGGRAGPRAPRWRWRPRRRRAGAGARQATFCHEADASLADRRSELEQCGGATTPTAWRRRRSASRQRPRCTSTAPGRLRTFAGGARSWLDAQQCLPPLSVPVTGLTVHCSHRVSQYMRGPTCWDRVHGDIAPLALRPHL